jgi:hypothetical protein
MTRPLRGAALLAAVLTLPWSAHAETAEVAEGAPSADRMTWTSDHPVSIGNRAGAWDQGYLEPGLGGSIRFQPWAAVGIEGFSDNFGWVRSGVFKRDFVNGFNLFFPLTRNRSWTIAPQLGVCDDFQVVSPFGTSGPTVTDVLIGAHAGVQFEARLGGGLAVEAALDAYGYLGHGAGVDRWTASLSDSLSGHAVAVSTVGFNYYF